MRDLSRQKQSACVLALLVASAVPAQTPSHGGEGPGVSWQVRLDPGGTQRADQADLVFDAAIAPGWILYSSDFKAQMGPRPARFSFDPTDATAVIGSIRAIRPLRRKDRTWRTEYTYFQRRGEFRQRIQIKGRPATVSGHIDGQACQEESGTCTLVHEQFTLRIE